MIMLESKWIPSSDIEWAAPKETVVLSQNLLAVAVEDVGVNRKVNGSVENDLKATVKIHDVLDDSHKLRSSHGAVSDASLLHFSL